MNELQLFNNEELGLNVRAYVDEERNLFINAEDVARGLGFTQIKNGKEYVRYERVNRYLTEFGMSPLVEKGDYIPEPLIYLLSMKASNKTAVSFQKWLSTDVLPTLRKTGSYSVEDNIKNEYLTEEIDEVKFSFGSLEYFFSNIPSKDLETEYKLCKAYYSSYNHRIIGKTVCETKEVVGRKIIDILINRKDNTDNTQEQVRCLDLARIIEHEISVCKNISNGKKIAKANNRIEELLQKNPELMLDTDFIYLPVHGFSANYMYSVDGHKRTCAYNHFSDDIRHMLNSNAEYNKQFWLDRGVDFNKKIILTVGFVHKRGMDIDNFLKSFIDNVITKFYGINDKNITDIRVKTLDYCNDYSEGEIFFNLRNDDRDWLYS